MNKEKSPQLS